MADRTVKLYGKAYGSSVSMTVTFNGTQVFNGAVSSVDQETVAQVSWENMDELCSFTISTDVTGNIPLVIDVSGGDILYHTMHTNYSGPIFTDDPALQADTLVTATASNFSDISNGVSGRGETTDGKSSVVIDGISQSITYTGGVVCYEIADGSTFECNQFVSTAELSDIFPFNP